VSSADAAGNVGTAADAESYTVDIAVAPPTVAPVNTTNVQPTLSGGFDAADTVQLSVTVDGVTYVQGHPALVLSGNTWSLDLALAGQTLPAGATYSVGLSALDGAGNVVSNASAGVVTITAPATPPATVTPPATGAAEAAVPAFGQASGGTVSTPPSGQPGTGLPIGIGGVPIGAAPADIRLGLPVDRTVRASDMGIRESANQLLRSPAFDLNALPPTAAGAFDPFGFPVERMSMDRANDLMRSRGALPLVGHYLFEYHGIVDLAADGRIPVDAFAHTDPAAIVHLSARLMNGMPLPAWLRLDARGAFVGIPPDGLEGKLDIEVVARDTEGREARTSFELQLDSLREAAAAKAAADLVLGLDVDKEEAKKEKARAEKLAAKATPRFSEQMKVAKAKSDPLLDRILKDGQTKPRA